MRLALKLNLTSLRGVGASLFAAPQPVWSDDGDGTHSWTFVFDPGTAAGMKVKGEYSTSSSFSSIFASVSDTLDSGEISGTPFAFTTGDFSDGVYYARFWTTDANDLVNSAVSDTTSFTVVNLLADTYLTSGNGGEQAIVSTTTTYDFAVITLGTADPGLRKHLTLILNTNGGTAASHSSAVAYPTATDRTNGTNGVTLTKACGTGQSVDTASTNFQSIFDGNIGSMTSAYVRLTASAAPARATLHGYTHGRGNSTDFARIGSAATLNLSETIDVDADGITVFGASVTNGATATATATGYTEAFDRLASGTLYITGGKYDNDNVADVNHTVQATWTAGSNSRLVAASFGAKVNY